MSDDPFSDILRFANARSVISGGFTAGGAWALRFPAPDKIKFFALLKGGCWLCRDGEPPLRIETGDVILLTAQQPFALAGDLAATPIEATGLFSDEIRFAKLGEGEDCVQIGGHVRLDPASGGFLTEALPPLIHVRAGAPQAAILQWLLDQLVRERSADLPGAGIASAQLAQLMFVQILRAHLDAPSEALGGWLRAVADKRLSPALRLIHAEPGRPWQLGELARAAAMSRTSFAVHFKKVAGVAPLAYLAGWRMRLAERALRENDMSISALARSLGYTSESAFSNAFKRATGQAPRRYRSAFAAVPAGEPPLP